MKKEKVQREWCYIQAPHVFELPGCSCGNENIQWSEYQGHLWCDKCQLDFMPEHNGIFDNPIGIGMAKMLGITFTRINLKTDLLEALDSKNNYMVVLDLNKFKFNESFPVTLENKDNKQYQAKLLFNPENLTIETDNLPYGDYRLEITTYSNLSGFKEWGFIVHLADNEVTIKEFHKNKESFKAFLLNEKLNQELTVGKQINKVKI